jgi:hypothetical protein
MLPASVPERDERTCNCGYVIPEKDLVFIQDQGIWHIICYGCGTEWIQ